jgi:hypothetical protein
VCFWGVPHNLNQTPLRGQDGKISDTRGKDIYWSPTRRSLVGDQKSFPWVSEIFPSCPLTGVRSYYYNQLEYIESNRHSIFHQDIKDLTPVRGQDGKISDTQGKDFWSPTRLY